MTALGTLLLEGGAEFGGKMSEPDRRAMDLAGGLAAPVAILPTAAAPDHNDERAGRNAARWFSSLGAKHVDVVPVIDKASAGNAELAARLRGARLIYMLGGFPGYLAATLAGSRAWQAALGAWQAGAVIGGSSAGAMVLCQHMYDPEQKRVVQGLGLLPNACVIPHHNGFGSSWAPRLMQLLPPSTALIGIDEQTGILNDAGGTWTVYGGGQVTLYQDSLPARHSPGDTLALQAP